LGICFSRALQEQYLHLPNVHEANFRLLNV